MRPWLWFWNPRERKMETKSILTYMIPALLASLVIMLSACTQTNVDALLASGQEHLQNDDYDAAIEDFEAATEANPDSVAAYLALGEAYVRQAESTGSTSGLLDAIQAFRTAIALEPNNPAAHHNLGTVYFQANAIESAIQEFETALELEPDSAESHYQLGAIYLNLAFPPPGSSAPINQEHLSQAIQEFEAALAIEQNMPEALIGLANAYIAQEAYQTALDTLQEVLEQIPDSPQAYYALGNAYAQLGDTTNACDAYRAFLNLNPPADWRANAEQAMNILGCP